MNERKKQVIKPKPELPSFFPIMNNLIERERWTKSERNKKE